MKLCTKLNFSPTEDSFPIKVLQEAFKVSIEESEQITNDFVTGILKNNGYNIESMTRGKENDVRRCDSLLDVCKYIG